MRVLGKQFLVEFKQKYIDAIDQVDYWIDCMENTTFKNSHDVKNKYASASFLAKNVVIFNLKGNKYRIEVKIAYNASIIEVIWLGSHNEYDKRNKILRR